MQELNVCWRASTTGGGEGNYKNRTPSCYDAVLVHAHPYTMFDFLFKRSPKKPAPEATPVTSPVRDALEVNQQRKQAELARRKEAALQQLASLNGQEAALVDFILGCDLADIRLKAAEQLHSAAALEPVLQGMRNSDRRVTKLAQTRLKDLAQRQTCQQQAHSCIDTARQLQLHPALPLNKVAELDHLWQQLAINDGELLAAYAAARAALGERLKAQSDLQRALVHALAELRELAAGASEMALTDLTQKLEQLANEVAVYASDSESHALPKPALAQFAQEYAQLHKSLDGLQRRHAAISEREAALVVWENTDTADLKAAEMKRQWQHLPPLLEDEGYELQQRYEAQLLRVVHPKEVQRETLGAEESKKAFVEALDALEAAVQDGLLQVGSHQDKILRGLDIRSARPTDSQMLRLTHARTELGRLKDWANWGGNVSREELVKAVEELPAQELAVTELAKRVGSSRERWKALDLSAGPAPKGLWERFDTACTSAYAPVAAHYKQLGEERQNNQTQAQGLLDDVLHYARTTLAAAAGEGDAVPSVDWKAVSAFVRDVRLSWKRLGTIERKDKKRLDAEFESALQSVLQPLAEQRQAEVSRREKLIADVTRLSSNDRGAMDTVRALQARWQEQAKALPLERSDEQALWQRFREACDTFFAKRKATAEAADSERHSNLAAREAVCIALEAAVDETDVAVTALLRDSQAAWNTIGQVPRAAEQDIEQRYQKAVAVLQQQVDTSKRAAAQARGNALRDKWRLCQELESFLVGKRASMPVVCETMQERWNALPALSADDERVMRARFEAALAAAASAEGKYVEMLKQNETAFAEALLRQEIIAGLESPPELAALRLKLQVEVLKASMKSGQKPAAQRAQLVTLCALPVLADAGQQGRLEKLLDAVPS